MSGRTEWSVTVVGAGVVGTNLARALAARGHRITFAARDGGSAKVTAALEAVPGSRVVPLDRAGEDADVVVLAVPSEALGPTVAEVGGIDEHVVVVDATNAVGGPVPGGHATLVDLVRSLRPGWRLVKAFNTIGAEAYLAPELAAGPAFLPIAGDAAGAELVRALAAGLGFDAVVLGGYDAVVLCEDHARLWIHLTFRLGLGRDHGFVRSGR